MYGYCYVPGHKPKDCWKKEKDKKEKQRLAAAAKAAAGTEENAPAQKAAAAPAKVPGGWLPNVAAMLPEKEFREASCCRLWKRKLTWR